MSDLTDTRLASLGWTYDRDTDSWSNESLSISLVPEDEMLETAKGQLEPNQDDEREGGYDEDLYQEYPLGRYSTQFHEPNR